VTANNRFDVIGPLPAPGDQIIVSTPGKPVLPGNAA
jgi:hypothetical protein